MGPSIITIFGLSFNIFGVILLVLGLLFCYGLWTAHRNKNLDWTDLITRDGTTVSTTKILQLVGGVVATWVIVQVTLGGALTWDLFAIYLAYVASIDGFSKLLMAKYGADKSDDARGFANYNYHRSQNRQPQNRYNQYPATRPIDDELGDGELPAGGAKTPNFD